jgi:hypothetical protein
VRNGGYRRARVPTGSVRIAVTRSALCTRPAPSLSSRRNRALRPHRPT